MKQRRLGLWSSSLGQITALAFWLVWGFCLPVVQGQGHSRSTDFGLARPRGIEGRAPIEGKAPRHIAPTIQPFSVPVVAVNEAARARFIASYGQLPLKFEPNQGQTDDRVKFLSRGHRYTLFLTANDAVLALQKPSAVSGPAERDCADLVSRSAALKRSARAQAAELKSNSALHAAVLGSADPSSGSAALEKPQGQAADPELQAHTGTLSPESLTPAVLHLKLVDTNPAAEVMGLEDLPGKSNYFRSNDPKKWRTNVPNYAKVQYKDVYPGVDLIYYGNQQQLEYDFIVAPGAHPNVIRFGFDVAGADRSDRPGREVRQPGGAHAGSPLRVDANGDLVLHIEGGEIRFRKPVAFQLRTDGERPGEDGRKSETAKRKLIDARYVLRRPKIGNLKSPVANPQYEVGFEIASYDPAQPLIIDPVLSYSSYLGGSAADSATGVAIDSTGNLYIAGRTSSTDFPTQGAVDTVCNNCATFPNLTEAFVTKLNAAGSAVLYSTYLGGGDFDEALGLAVDSNSNAYVAGRTFSTDFPIASAYQAVTAGGSDAFVAKLNANGSLLVYSTYLGGTNHDSATAIAVDSTGRAYVTGFTQSNLFPTASALDATLSGVRDAFVTKLNPTGTGLDFSTFLGGAETDIAEEGSGIAVDSSGNAWVTGRTQAINFPVTAGAFDSSCGSDGNCDGLNNPDAFVTGISANGSTLLYSTYLGGGDMDSGHAITVDGSGNIYITGFTKSVNFPVTSGAFQIKLAAEGFDAFVAKFNSALSGVGSLVYSTYLGGDGFDAGRDVAVDSSGNAYVAGETGSVNFPQTSPLQQQGCSTCPTASDAFVAKLNAVGSFLVFCTFLGGIGDDAVTGLALDSSGNAYVAGGTDSSDFPLVNALDGTFGGSSCGADPLGNALPCGDAFVAKMTGLALPVATLSSTSLTFGDQVVGTTSSSQTITLKNNGDTALDLSVVSSAEFNQTNNCGGSLAAGASCTLNVSFAPATSGSKSGKLTVTSNAFGSPHEVTLTGKGVSVAIATLSTTTLAFGDQRVDTSSTRSVTLTNTGTGIMTISTIGTNLAGFTLNPAHNCPLSPSRLAAGASCTINVTFTPTATGAVVGALTINDDGPGNPHVVSLTGTGVAPAVSLSNNTLSFADQRVGTTSSSQTVTLTNNGAAPLTISSIGVSGDFAQTNNCPLAPATLAAGANCTINVTFKPTTTEVPRRGTVTITDDAPGSPHAVSLSGTGIAPAVSLSQSSLSFGSQPVGTTSSVQTVTLTNSGAAPLTISNLAASGEFAQTNTCPVSPATLAVGANCTISVSFKPTVTEVRRGAIIINDDASGSPHTLALSGVGADFSVFAIPSSTTITAGQPATYTLTITPIGGFNRAIDLSCGGAPQAATCSIAPTSVTPDGSTPPSAKVTVTTTARSMMVPKPLPPSPPVGRHVPFRLWLPVLAMLAIFLASRRRRPVLTLTALLVLVLLWVACGGDGGGGARAPSGTPAGSYALTFTATSGDLSHNTTVSLVVN